jgi:hypothetical protein
MLISEMAAARKGSLVMGLVTSSDASCAREVVRNSRALPL